MFTTVQYPQNKNIERVNPDALAHLRKSGVNVEALESRSETLLATPRSVTPIDEITRDCDRHPHPNRLDTLDTLLLTSPGYDRIHTTVFTQQPPSVEEHEQGHHDVFSHQMFTTDNDPRVTSVVHFDKRQGTIRLDGSYAGPWPDTEHEIRHAIDYQKHTIATRMGKEPENLDAYDLWQQEKAERNGIESANFIAKRFGLPLQKTYDEYAGYLVDNFTDSLPKSQEKRELILKLPMI